MMMLRSRRGGRGGRLRVDGSLLRHGADAGNCLTEPFIAAADLVDIKHGSDFADHS